MANPWDALKDGVLVILKSSVKDLIDIGKQDAKDLLEDVAENMARQTYLLEFGNDDEKAQAPGNIRSLKAQAVIDAADVVVVGSSHVMTAFSKIVETAGEWLIQYGPIILRAVAK